jgi:hypothetical protein
MPQKTFRVNRGGFPLLDGLPLYFSVRGYKKELCDYIHKKRRMTLSHPFLF